MTITKEGALASFYTVNKAPIKHLRVHFSPKQAGSGDASPENVREISGWDGVDVYHTKTNLFSYDVSYKEPSNITLQDTNNRVFTPYTYAYGASWSNWWQPNQVISCTVNRNEIKITTNRADYGAGFAIPIKSGKTLHISYINKNNIGRTYLAFYDENGKYITGGQYESNQLRTIPEDAVIIVLIFSSNNKEEAVFTDVSVTYEDTFSYEPYSGQNHTLDWSNNIGTIPGGYIDLVTGELAETYNCIALDSTAPFNNIAIINSDTNLLRFRMYLNEITNKTIKSISNPNFAIFNYLKSVGETTLAWNGYFTGGSTNPRLAVYVQDNNITSIDSFLDYLNIHPLQVCYELETPIIHQLTPTQLSTLIGRNNIWSNADRVEVEYDLAESNDELYRRRNILMRSAPHIETASGSIAHFETDIAAPIKSAKINFSPVQKGSGEPSPTNVRAISGWNGIKITACGKNMLQSWRSVYGRMRTDGETDGNNISVTYLNNGFQVTGTASKTGTSNLNGASNLTELNSYNAPLLQKNQTYIISCNKTSLIGCQGQAIADGWSGWLYPGHAFTMPNDGKVWLYSGISVTEGETYNESITNMQLEYGSTPTEYESFHGATIPINWQTAAGTIYGGYIDLITGEVWNTWWYNHKDVAENEGTITNNRRRIAWNLASAHKCDTSLSSLSVCNIASYGNTGYPVFSVSSVSAYLYLDPSDTNAYSVDIYYPSQTPYIAGRLSPTQLKTLRGTNNIWTDSNGPVEIKYWTH